MLLDAGSGRVERRQAAADVPRFELERRGCCRGATAVSERQQLPSVRRRGRVTAEQARTLRTAVDRLRSDRNTAVLLTKLEKLRPR